MSHLHVGEPFFTTGKGVHGLRAVRLRLGSPAAVIHRRQVPIREAHAEGQLNDRNKHRVLSQVDDFAIGPLVSIQIIRSQPDTACHHVVIRGRPLMPGPVLEKQIVEDDVVGLV
jgi:hypothetical protein